MGCGTALEAVKGVVFVMDGKGGVFRRKRNDVWSIPRPGGSERLKSSNKGFI